MNQYLLLFIKKYFSIPLRPNLITALLLPSAVEACSICLATHSTTALSLQPRVVPHFLAEVDGMKEVGYADKQVVVIAASNRPDLIDQALFRPGRFVGRGFAFYERLGVRALMTAFRCLMPCWSKAETF